MPFDYASSGLPDHPQWRAATEACYAWLSQHMSMFGPERLNNFMVRQPVTAAKLIMANCPDWSEESVTLALLGPAKASAETFDDKTKALFEALSGKGVASKMQERDLIRLFLVEGLSTMNDQLIGRVRIDQHHQTRWKILHDLEMDFIKVKGQNPGLDPIFEKALAESRSTLAALDKHAI